LCHVTLLLQAIQQGSVDALLAAAAATRNSMCGLFPLTVALEALYGGSSAGGGCAGSGGCAASGSSTGGCAASGSSAAAGQAGSSAGGGCAGSSGSDALAAALPQLLDYRAAHTIFERPDSTGFAAFAVYAR
jgi:hypothetical protein